MDLDNFLPFSGTAQPILDVRATGYLDVFNQELRVAGGNVAVDWVAGATYDYTRADDNTSPRIVGLELSLLPLDRIYQLGFLTSNVEQTVHTYSVFANVEYRFTEQFSAHAGLRYSSTKRDASNCVFEQPGPIRWAPRTKSGKGSAR